MFALPLAFGLFAGSIAQAPSPSSSPQATPVAVATPAVSSSRAAGLVLPPVPNVGPTPNLPANALPSGDLVGTSGPFVALALSDAIGMAMARNTDLGVAQSNRRIAGYQIVAA
ncbi:MAG: hypothetical protein GIW95_03875, partial [Candidatus Eremiobacteraeota bacterium]|nr:hypothetical protein [Candidatus Eremiobacteraeota bacterium]